MSSYPEDAKNCPNPRKEREKIRQVCGQRAQPGERRAGGSEHLACGSRRREHQPPRRPPPRRPAAGRVRRPGHRRPGSGSGCCTPNAGSSVDGLTWKITGSSCRQRRPDLHARAPCMCAGHGAGISQQRRPRQRQENCGMCRRQQNATRKQAEGTEPKGWTRTYPTDRRGSVRTRAAHAPAPLDQTRGREHAAGTGRNPSGDDVTSHTSVAPGDGPERDRAGVRGDSLVSTTFYFLSWIMRTCVFVTVVFICIYV